MSTNPAFHRLELLIGPESVNHLGNVKVALFGLGGVGSWCAEGLVRSGIRHLTIVDSDHICATNINRQLQATEKTIGKAKVMELQQRLTEINPDADILPVAKIYDQSSGPGFELDQFDYVVDAIDSLSAKVDLIARTQEAGPVLFSALGASCKLDPTRIQIDSFWKTRGCPLAKHLRKRLRNRGATADFKCVYSNENRHPFPMASPCGSGNCHCPATESGHEHCASKKQINGSVVHITAIFGFYLSGLVVNDVLKKINGVPAEK